MRHSTILKTIRNEAVAGHACIALFISNDPRLSATAKATIEDDGNEVFVSIASLWEISIKLSLAKLRLPIPFDQAFPQQLEVNGFELLPINLAELNELTRLPFHHRDPFDRLLIAQALAQQTTVVTHDPAFTAYPVTTLW
jgi:PIN domain nuclease of toxin-antitoxin system